MKRPLLDVQRVALHLHQCTMTVMDQDLIAVSLVLGVQKLKPVRRRKVKP